MFASLFRQASLREDYLNQVQRDFLSLSFAAKTPLADAMANFNCQFAIAGWILRHTQKFVQMGGGCGVLE